jgi:hypothetical protein
MNDILDEAIYDYKEEKKLKRLKTFLKIVGILTVFGIIAIYTYTYYLNKSSKNNKFYTETLLELTNTEYRPDDKIYKEKINLLLKQSNKHIKQLALFNLVSAYMKNNDLDRAIENLDLIIDGEYSKTSKKLAMISKFGIYLDRISKSSLEHKEKKFVDLFLQKFEDKSGIFHSKAMMYKALWHIKQGNEVKAKEILAHLKSSAHINNFDKANAACILSNLELKSPK